MKKGVIGKMDKLAAKKGTVISVIIITLIISYVAFFGVNIGKFSLMGAADMRFGIDIRGGIDAEFAPKDLGRLPTSTELDAARAVIETRLVQRNITDYIVTADKSSGYILVQFPWKSSETNFDPVQAISELGSMAQLTFKDPDGNVVMDGSDVSKAAPASDPNKPGGYLVQLTLKSSGVTKFSDATGRLVGQKISIYLDTTLISNPTVQSHITTDTCTIDGMASMADATTLANQINSGALPFALETKTYNIISPELGSNALTVMVWAGVVAFILIALGLIFYYRASGVIAVISLMFHLTGQLILLTWPQFSITLTGMAGIILSIGIGVDANVIAAERVRDEIRKGKSIQTATVSGFKQAISAIRDGNATLLIVALVMMWLGSGSLVSFSYTLIFGIIMNVLAGVIASRLMTVSLSQNKWLNSRPSFFMGKRMLALKEVKTHQFSKQLKHYGVIIGAIMVLGIVMIFVNGVNLDINFRGGIELNYSLADANSINASEAASKAGDALGGKIVTGQIMTDFATGVKSLKLSVAGGNGDTSSDQLQQVTDALVAAYPDQNITLNSSNNVSAYFSQRFLRNAVLALVISSALIVLYVWIAFRKMRGFSAGAFALLALLCDICVAFFSFIIFKLPIGDSFVAVALTIMGFAINDTIVIYDRIRENVALNKNMPIVEVVDRSISKSFARSLNIVIALFTSVAVLTIFSLANNLQTVTSFALPMSICTVFGGFTTLCFTGPMWAKWQERKINRAQPLNKKTA